MAKQPAFDPYELGARNADPDNGGLEPLSPLLHRIQPMKWLGWFAVAVVVLTVFRTSLARPPEAKGSCSSPAFAVSSKDVDRYGALRWSANGPTGSSVVLGLDTTVLPTSAADGRVTGPVAVKDCAAHGVLGVQAEPGEHTVVAYLVAKDGTSREVTRTKVTVNAP